MRVLNCILLSFVLTGGTAYSQGADHWEEIIDAADTWKYIIPSSEPSPQWTDAAFDDSGWLSGPGGFGYGDDDDGTLVPVGTISVFMRKSFTLASSSELVSAFLCINYDDGFVAYLNGIEIARANIGTAGIRPAYGDFATNATEPPSASGAPPASFPVENSLLRAALVNGVNILAVQVHNRDGNSSDLSSGTYFIGGFSNTDAGFRLPPEWFVAPVYVTSHLPLVVIDTWGGYIPSEPKVAAWLKVIDNGPGQLNSTGDPGTDFEGIAGIEIRGQSSQMFPKKSYGFETRNDTGEDSAVSLLGMPGESDWVLTASYSDKTMMRNPVTYYLGGRMGRWQPRTRWCEVYINGDYQGVYALIEKIKRDKDRVDINKLTPDELAGDSLTGGYILKVDKLDGLSADSYFKVIPRYTYRSTYNYDFTYVYPKADEIMPEQKEYIKNFLTDLASAVNSPDFKDGSLGFRNFMDQNSFADFQIMQELSNNVDAYHFSTFFYKDKDSKGGKLNAGPLWDFDLCYGNVDYAPPRLATNTWVYVNYGPSLYNSMPWWVRLMEDPDYRALVKSRYSMFRAGPLATDSVFAFLDSCQAYLGDAIDRNFAKWPILDQYIWPNAYIGNTYDNEMDYLKSWLTSRLNWLDAQWLIPLSNSSVYLQQGNFSVYPNPFHSSLNIILAPPDNSEVVIEIYNIQGSKQLTRNIRVSDSREHDYRLENISLPPGIYLLRAYQSGRLLGNLKIIRE